MVFCSDDNVVHQISEKFLPVTGILKIIYKAVLIILGGVHDNNPSNSNVWKYYTIWQLETPLSTKMSKHRTFFRNGDIWHHLGHDNNSRFKLFFIAEVTLESRIL